jgi:hypothetical protein
MLRRTYGWDIQIPTRTRHRWRHKSGMVFVSASVSGNPAAALVHHRMSLSARLTLTKQCELCYDRYQPSPLPRAKCRDVLALGRLLHATNKNHDSLIQLPVLARILRVFSCNCDPKAVRTERRYREANANCSNANEHHEHARNSSSG